MEGEGVCRGGRLGVWRGSEAARGEAGGGVGGCGGGGREAVRAGSLGAGPQHAECWLLQGWVDVHSLPLPPKQPGVHTVGLDGAGGT